MSDPIKDYARRVAIATRDAMNENGQVLIALFDDQINAIIASVPAPETDYSLYGPPEKRFSGAPGRYGDPEGQAFAEAVTAAWNAPAPSKLPERCPATWAGCPCSREKGHPGEHNPDNAPEASAHKFEQPAPDVQAHPACGSCARDLSSTFTYLQSQVDAAVAREREEIIATLQEHGEYYLAGIVEDRARSGAKGDS